MGRKSLKDLRQQEIISTFYQVAKKIGYEHTSIAKVAKAMDINPSLIIHYFATKEDLKMALIDYILERYLLIYKQGETKKKGVERLKLIVDRLFSKKWNTLFDDGLFYSFYAASFREAKIKEKYKTILDSLRDELRKVLEELNSDGSTNIADISRTADMVFILLDGAYFYLSLVDNKSIFQEKLALYKKEAYVLLGINA
ncbi:TetR family transcriptional regulator [Olivibacter sp. CPCC 100613]|uniref:TetR family transcriptional regulator n=1 Tax=Olivibacter sp. CPCC 100613 TaxID=3079931 RepID=UPI002FF8AF6F